MPLPASAKLMAAGFAASGIVHLVRPGTFEPIMPRWVPRHREVIAVSGVAEILCAVAMTVPVTQKAACYVGVGILVGVFPAHITMAQDAFRSNSTALKVVALARMPLQVPMIRAVIAGARAA